MTYRTDIEILEMHFGSDFHEIKEPCYLTHIQNAMQEYKSQELHFLMQDMATLKEAFFGLLESHDKCVLEVVGESNIKTYWLEKAGLINKSE